MRGKVLTQNLIQNSIQKISKYYVNKGFYNVQVGYVTNIDSSVVNGKNLIFNIHIQNPKVNHNLFDLIICPEHDNLDLENCISTMLALHNIKFKKDGTYIFRVSVRCVIRYAKLQPIKQKYLMVFMMNQNSYPVEINTY